MMINLGEEGQAMWGENLPRSSPVQSLEEHVACLVGASDLEEHLSVHPSEQRATFSWKPRNAYCWKYFFDFFPDMHCLSIHSFI